MSYGRLLLRSTGAFVPSGSSLLRSLAASRINPTIAGRADG